MKKLIFLFCILFSLNSFAYSNIRYTSEDFDLFPLTTSNSQLIEGVWTGKSISIKIDEMNVTMDDKVYMWVTITNLKTGDVKSAILYYHREHGGYEIFVFGPDISIPLEIMIFKYSDRVAFERKMKCRQGGYVMRLMFNLGDGEESQAVQLQRETCSEQ